MSEETKTAATHEEAAGAMRTAINFWRAAGLVVLAGERQRDGATVIVLPNTTVKATSDGGWEFLPKKQG